MTIEKTEEGLTISDLTYKDFFLVRLLQVKDKTETITTLPPEVRALGAKHIKELIDLITSYRIKDITHLGPRQLNIVIEEVVEEGVEPLKTEDLDRLFKDTIVTLIIDSLDDEIAEIRKGVARAIIPQPSKPPKSTKIKRSGHLQDQILKYTYPSKSKAQLSIWDSLKSDTKKHIETLGVERTEIVEGIKLTPSETKLIDCLCKLLHEGSQNSDPGGADYYSGNSGYEIDTYGGESTPAPKLAFTLYELTKEFKGGDGERVSGKDIENVKQVLRTLDSRRFLLSYKETTRRKDGSRVERTIEEFRKLIGILKISQTEFSRDNIELSKQEETVIVLSPIFRRQIDSKFILYPADINRRTIIAYGSHNLSDVSLRLREYLIRELSNKRYTPEIGLEKLYYQLAEKWMRESRKKKVKEYTDKALEVVKALGLLLDYRIEDSATGEPKVVFTLNKDWE